VSKRGGPEGERARKTHFREVLEPGWEHAGSGSETGREAHTGYGSKLRPKRRYRGGRWGGGGRGRGRLGGGRGGRGGTNTQTDLSYLL
jgi:hypothetical protein